MNRREFLAGSAAAIAAVAVPGLAASAAAPAKYRCWIVGESGGEYLGEYPVFFPIDPARLWTDEDILRYLTGGPGLHVPPNHEPRVTNHD